MSSIARLLIVDDEKAQMRALCDTLQLEGYSTTGSQTALDSFAEWKMVCVAFT